MIGSIIADFQIQFFASKNTLLCIALKRNASAKLLLIELKGKIKDMGFSGTIIFDMALRENTLQMRFFSLPSPYKLKSIRHVPTGHLPDEVINFLTENRDTFKKYILAAKLPLEKEEALFSEPASSAKHLARWYVSNGAIPIGSRELLGHNPTRDYDIAVTNLDYLNTAIPNSFSSEEDYQACCRGEKAFPSDLQRNPAVDRLRERGTYISKSNIYEKTNTSLWIGIESFVFKDGSKLDILFFSKENIESVKETMSIMKAFPRDTFLKKDKRVSYFENLLFELSQK